VAIHSKEKRCRVSTLMSALDEVEYTTLSVTGAAGLLNSRTSIVESVPMAFPEGLSDWCRRFEGSGDELGQFSPRTHDTPP